MTTSPGSSSPEAQLGTDLKAGLAAFKQGNYPAAIALLESALSAPSDGGLITQAQMALAIAYERLGETLQAANLCQRLAQSPNPQAKEWAARTLTTLVKRHPHLSSLAVPPEQVQAGAELAAGTQIPHNGEQLAPSIEPVGDRTGFVPLSSTSSPESSEASPTPQLSETGALTTGSAAIRRKVALPSVAPSGPAVAETLTDSASPIPETTPETYQPIWRVAGRASQWKPLGKVNPLRLIAVEMVTLVGLFWVVQQLIHRCFGLYGYSLNRLVPALGFRWVLWGEPNWSYRASWTMLAIAFLGSHLILDALLTRLYRLKPLSLDTLATHSPEAARSLPQFCRKQRLPIPALRLLPIPTPLIFSYGVLPWVTRIVVSQGLLEQLADDEIAALFANEVGHVSYWDVPLMSMLAVLLHIPYTLYRVTAEWGNRKQAPISRLTAGLVAAIAYGLFRLLRWVGLWFSRQRTYYSDRLAVDFTGNPNGYTRALLKLAIGAANDVQRQGQTNYLLEGFDLLTPLGHRIGTSLGSVHAHTPLEPILESERQNPYRHWLSINQTHPPTGERLHLLTLYARHWQLDSELEWQNPTPQRRGTGLTGQQWKALLLQGAPYFGLALGLGIAWLFSLVGFLGQRAHFEVVSWMARDRTLFQGLPLIGFGLGTLIRINPSFPDIKPDIQPSLSRSNSPSEPTLRTLWLKSKNVPVQGQTVRLQGTLLGRPGISNRLNQDLFLQTPTGLIRLHGISRFGPLGNLLTTQGHATDLLGQELTLTGWFRRGATPWIDIETLRTRTGKVSRSNHPVWSTLVAAIASVLGILILLDL